LPSLSIIIVIGPSIRHYPPVGPLFLRLVIIVRHSTNTVLCHWPGHWLIVHFVNIHWSSLSLTSLFNWVIVRCPAFTPIITSSGRSGHWLRLAGLLQWSVSSLSTVHWPLTFNWLQLGLLRPSFIVYSISVRLSNLSGSSLSLMVLHWFIVSLSLSFGWSIVHHSLSFFTINWSLIN